MKILRHVIASALLCMLTGSSALAADQVDCRLRRYAKLPMSLDEAGSINVPMTVAGQPVKMLVDTGGGTSMLTEGAAARLKLPRGILKGIEWIMFGGRTLKYYAEAPFTIGPATVHSHSFILIPDDLMAGSNDGILASDVLAVFDVDFDFANSALTLFLPHPCAGNAVWWTKDDYAEIPFKIDDVRHILLTVKLDGEEVRTLLDTGASDSVMSQETARKHFNISDEQLKEKESPYKFKALSFDGVTVQNPRIGLIPDKKSKLMGGYWNPSLIIGMGILRQLHMLIAYKEKKIYVTPASAH